MSVQKTKLSFYVSVAAVQVRHGLTDLPDNFLLFQQIDVGRFVTTICKFQTPYNTKKETWGKIPWCLYILLGPGYSVRLKHLTLR
jgi:hypothetical protein